jgi:hypothetical protein
MSLCKVCFPEIVHGIPVPSWHPDEKSDRTFVHEECFLGSFYCLGSATTKAGIAVSLYEQRSRLLVADEIDKFETKDIAILLSPAETGISIWIKK